MTRIAGLRVDVDGTASAFECDHESMLQPLYQATGGDLVECVAINPLTEMWVDEEGAISGRQVPNPYASALYMASHRGLNAIYGPVVFLGATDDEGWSTMLPPEQLGALMALAASDDPYSHLLGG